MKYYRHNFLSFWAIFCPFTPLLTKKIKIWNKCKNKIWRYYPITHLYHKWRSYDVWFLRYKAQQTEFFVILGHFLPFDPPNNLKNQNFEKMKKILKILSFYICIPQMMIIWCLVPEIWSTTGKFFCHFGLFFALFPPNNSENQKFEKMKKATIDIIILQMCTINENDMIYGSWDVEPDR